MTKFGNTPTTAFAIPDVTVDVPNAVAAAAPIAAAPVAAAAPISAADPVAPTVAAPVAAAVPIDDTAPMMVVATPVAAVPNAVPTA